MASLRDTDLGAFLVAVERANGGELAPLAQVLWTLESLATGPRRSDPATFVACARSLVDLGLVEYLEGQLGLTPQGRKLLRRSGLPADARHVRRVTELIAELIDTEIYNSSKSSDAPSLAELSEAIEQQRQMEQNPDGLSTPFIGEEIPTTTSLFGFGKVGLAGGTRWVPQVGPDDCDDALDIPLRDLPEETPPHPLLDRLLRRERREHNGSATDQSD
jgi:hypothetical protein